MTSPSFKKGVIPSRSSLELLYRRYNRRDLVHPDPLEFLYRYKSPHDREIVALIASSLAYGKVAQILRSVEKILSRLGPAPAAFIKATPQREFASLFKDFKHRFTGGEDMARLCMGVKNVLARHGSLENCFIADYKPAHGDTTIALETFARELTEPFGSGGSYLLPFPSKGSACKRLNLMLRWLVRCDKVDPGGWSSVSPSLLLVPLDTHMAAICRHLGILTRASADLKAVLEITETFRRIAPEDPVRYDFALTRFGIRDDLDMDHLLAKE
ncbi:MAG: TIGR02757 family protein [Lentisphaerae bacterium GWF2_52_8]|nr:MAG: TIGR02757 family protein [Lentisphaerae bacterium GWF2_52_8]